MSTPSQGGAFYVEAGAVFLPGRVARLLHARFGPELNRLRMAALNAEDRVTYSALVGLRAAALAAAPLPDEEAPTTPTGEVPQSLEWISSAQVADLLGISQRAVRLALESNRLAGHKDQSGRWQVARRDLQTYLAQKGR